MRRRLRRIVKGELILQTPQKHRARQGNKKNSPEATQGSILPPNLHNSPIYRNDMSTHCSAGSHPALKCPVVISSTLASLWLLSFSKASCEAGVGTYHCTPGYRLGMRIA